MLMKRVLLFILQIGHIHVEAAFGPPYALLRGLLEAQGNPFEKLLIECYPTLRRGSFAWVGSSPAFFISLVNHAEWGNEHTVFGSVLPEDMHTAKKIAALLTVQVHLNLEVDIYK
ncbi:unnamed protein product [Lupinus luteus]|uniref:Peptidylprolyl isomerase n=1 Tax=Lupinus luteus TaxID=3873 RepID=A0AAV1WUM0_LUPLU